MTYSLKLLLIQPPVQDFYDTDIRLQPIGLAHLKGAIRKHLPEVKVVIRDYHHGWGRKTISIPKELLYLRDYYAHHDKSPFSTFHHYYHFGAGFDEIVKDAQSLKPDLIGISSLFSPYYREALRIAHDLKAALGVPVLMGGSHVSALPERVLADAAVDFVIVGEGEKPIVEFLREFSGSKNWSQVSNLGWKKDGQLIFNKRQDNFPIEELPEPDLSDLNLQNYLYDKKPLSFVVTSRSCPHRCTFCSVHQTFGFRYRRQSVAKVLAGIKNRYEQGVRVFDFEDDNLTYYKDEMKDLCRGLIQLFPKQDVQFVAMNGISYLSLDSELMGLMRQAGFTHLNLALVSSDITVRETTKRPHTIPKYLEVVHEAQKLGFQIVSYQILGLPNETLDSMIQTLVFNARVPVLMGASMFYMTPNSPIDRSLREGRQADEAIFANDGLPRSLQSLAMTKEIAEENIFKSRLTAMAWETDDFKREDIYTLFITTRILNFLKGLNLLHDEADLEGSLEIARQNGGRDLLGAETLEKLLRGEGLFAATSSGLKPVMKFKTDLFFKVWNQLEYITTQSNRRLLLKVPSISAAKDLSITAAIT